MKVIEEKDMIVDEGKPVKNNSKNLCNIRNKSSFKKYPN